MKLESKIDYLKMDFSYSSIRETNNSKTPLGENGNKREKILSSLNIRNHKLTHCKNLNLPHPK